MWDEVMVLSFLTSLSLFLSLPPYLPLSQSLLVVMRLLLKEICVLAERNSIDLQKKSVNIIKFLNIFNNYYPLC